MAFTSAGLTNNGRTTHYQIQYDDSFSTVDGRDRANVLLASCEADFLLMSSWFAGVNLIFSYPIPVQIANDVGGAGWSDPPDWEVEVIHPSTVITIKPGTGTSAALIRYLLVSEVTEMFMASQKKGWFEDTSLFSGADEGSKGEGLSRFLGAQFQIFSGLGSVPPPGYGITPLWLNSPRPDFVNNNPDDHGPDATNGCTTLFLYYLHDQRGYGINQIISAGSSNLAGVYKNLTGGSDGWSPFINLVNDHYPPGFTYNPAGDSVFPVSELSQFYSPNQITCGYSQTTQIFIDRPAMAQVNIKLTSDNPALVSVPPVVTVPVGATSTSVTISAAAIRIPFPLTSVNVHATYAGKTLTISCDVVPPTIESVTLSPDTVVCGNPSTGTVTLNLPSLLGPVVLDLICGAPGFATVPAQVTIPQNSLSATFPITTPDIEVPFKTAHAFIYAGYAGYPGSYASAVLTVKPKVIAGILKSLTIFPATVTAGDTTRGTVTLEEAVPMDTVVGLAALEPGSIHIPLPSNRSSVANVPPSVKIRGGDTIAIFSIMTTDLLAPGTTRNATILAGAVVTKFAMLTITT